MSDDHHYFPTVMPLAVGLTQAVNNKFYYKYISTFKYKIVLPHFIPFDKHQFKTPLTADWTNKGRIIIYKDRMDI